MRVESLIALALVLLFLLYTCDRNAEPATDITGATPAVFDPWAAEMDILEFDIAQRTCALEVVMRPFALQVPDVSGRAVDDTMDSRDVDPDGTVLACT